MKFETVRIMALFKWLFGLLLTRNFASIATWRKDFSSPIRPSRFEHIFKKIAWKQTNKQNKILTH